MHQAGQPAEDHREAKSAGHCQMLSVGLTYFGRVVDESFFQHGKENIRAATPNFFAYLPSGAPKPNKKFSDIENFGKIMCMDQIDRKILAALQNDAGRSVAEIAADVGLSQSPCWRRIQKMEADGVIQRRVALLDPTHLNLGVTAFVTIRTNRHDPAWIETFTQAAQNIPEIVELYRMSGEFDYMLRIVVPDIAGFDAVYKKLIAGVALRDVNSSFAMEQIKYTTALPLDYA